jgi:hypothetical protein
VIIIQEQVNKESIAITVRASKLTAKGLAILLKKVAQDIKNHHNAAQTPQGKQSVKKLMNHNVATNTIEISGDKGLFDRVARKWRVDYAFHKTGRDKYLLLFKSGQADAITAAFAEYSALALKRAKDRRTPIMARFNKAAERVEKQRTQHKEHKREREAERDER